MSNNVNHRGGVGCEENFPGSNFTDEEREFIVAMDYYKRTHRRPFPTWREVLGVLKSLGYRKPPPTPEPLRPSGAD